MHGKWGNAKLLPKIGDIKCEIYSLEVKIVGENVVEKICPRLFLTCCSELGRMLHILRQGRPSPSEPIAFSHVSEKHVYAKVCEKIFLRHFPPKMFLFIHQNF